MDYFSIEDEKLLKNVILDIESSGATLQIPHIWIVFKAFRTSWDTTPKQLKYIVQSMPENTTNSLAGYTLQTLQHFKSKDTENFEEAMDGGDLGQVVKAMLENLVYTNVDAK